MNDVFALDMDEFDLRGALTGVIVLAIAIVFIGVFGPAGMAAGIAALFVVAGSGEEPASIGAQGAFVIAGAVVTLAAGYAAPSAVAATIVITGVTFLATLVPLVRAGATSSGAYLLIWAVLALSVSETDAEPWHMAFAFLLGGALAMAGTWISTRIADEADLPPEATSTDASSPNIDSSPLVRFAVLRAVGAGAAVALGYWWFPDHAAWGILTFVLVLRPPKEQTVIVGFGRTLGTLAGVIVAVLLVRLIGDSDTAVLIAFLVCGFFMVATTGVNYALSTSFTTAVLLLSQRILQEDVFSTSWERLLATVLGVVIAFAVIAAVRLTRPADPSSQPSTPATG